MPDLSPAEAAQIAKHVYGVKDLDTSLQDAAEQNAGFGIADKFQIAGDGRFAGNSGALLKSRTGFGYCATGIGRHAGDVLIATRGTASLPDALTDANIGLAAGPGGHLVHAGFNDSFQSYRKDIDSFMRNRNPTTVHCIGHSLGGALATLNAAYLASNQAAEIKLYTFGCPRTGAFNFANTLTRDLHAQNIRRVHHGSDIVSMVPWFPFQHAPSTGRTYTLPHSSTLSVSAHFMNTYIATIGQTEWRALPFSEKLTLKQEMASWIETGDLSGIKMFAVGSLTLLKNALAYLVEKSLSVVGGGALTATCTVLDKLAWLITQGARLSADILQGAGLLIRGVLKFLGRAMDAGKDVTVAILRYVLQLLASTLRRMAAQALEQALQTGRLLLG